jgi:hypothetical protein
MKVDAIEERLREIRETLSLGYEDETGAPIKHLIGESLDDIDELLADMERARWGNAS